MTETADPRYGWDLTEWNPSARRIVSLWVLGITAALLVASMVYFGIGADGLGVFLWIMLGLLGALFLTEVLVVATGLGAESGQAQTASSSSALAGAPGTQAGEEHVHVDLKCPECEEMFTIPDTGERPLPATCPHCGAEGHVDLPEHAGTSLHDAEPSQDRWSQQTPPAEPVPEPHTAEPFPEQDIEGKLTLRCPECQTEFTVDDTGQRPLETTCPGCGREGHLR